MADDKDPLENREGGSSCDDGKRDSSGRFGQGNKAAVGRRGAYEAQRAHLRSVLVGLCDDKRLIDWFTDIERIARHGAENKDRLGAYRLLLGYVLGAPQQDVTIKDDTDEALQKVREEIAARVHPAAKKQK